MSNNLHVAYEIAQKLMVLSLVDLAKHGEVAHLRFLGYKESQIQILAQLDASKVELLTTSPIPFCDITHREKFFEVVVPALLESNSDAQLLQKVRANIVTRTMVGG